MLREVWNICKTLIMHQKEGVALIIYVWPDKKVLIARESVCLCFIWMFVIGFYDFTALI